MEKLPYCAFQSRYCNHHTTQKATDLAQSGAWMAVTGSHLFEVLLADAGAHLLHAHREVAEGDRPHAASKRQAHMTLKSELSLKCRQDGTCCG